MQVYNYSPDTGEFTGATVARPDPLESGKFLIPAHATTMAPPDALAGTIPVFSGGEWSLGADLRGTEYWTITDNTVSPKETITEIGETMPDGAVLSDPGSRPSADHIWDGSEWVYVAPAPTAAAVDAERDRRINGGFTFDGAVYQTRPEDRENMAGAATSALAAIVSGAQAGDLFWHGGAEPFAWIAEDNSLTEMDAQTMLAFGQAAMAHKQAHIFAARAIKNTDPLPADITDDALWP